jgi:hypothetical protein
LIDAEVEKYASKVDEIEERVANLEEMIKELDGWTAELGLNPKLTIEKPIYTNLKD